MMIECKKCGREFRRATRGNKTCAACVMAGHRLAKNGGHQPKRRWIQSVNDSKGRFQGFISAPDKKEMALVQLPRGWKRFGKVF